MARDPIADADRLAGQGRVAEAVARLREAATPAASYHLAIWQLVGQLVRRDVAFARRLLADARAGGHVDAAMMEIALTANGSGGSADWPRARMLLEHLATTDPFASEQHDLLAQMNLDATGAPRALPEGEVLATSPRITRLRGFLSPAECAHVARVAGPLLEPAVVVDPATGRSIAHPIRTSDVGLVGPTREDLVVRAINLRIAAATKTDVAQGEALAVLRYRPGQQYRLHLDTLPGAANQRVRTVLIYLNSGYRGGQTVFPQPGVTVEPGGGDAIIFDSLLDNGQPDPASRHAGVPVEAGVKWLATRWLRARPFDPWIGPDSNPHPVETGTQTGQ